MQVAGGRFQVDALDERFPAQQRLLAGVQLLGLLQPVTPGGGHLDPVGTHRQRVGGVETQEGQTPKGGDPAPEKENATSYGSIFSGMSH